ncbi:MAG: hypothetical protein M1829_006626 [Trizodia sp. TS-e1964]|nr:MAG: hypothetical protein M1829_006626 [Trizodia sp. TS-e1964]
MNRLSNFQCLSSTLNINGLSRLDGRIYIQDSWSNIPPNVSNAIPRKLHLQKDHPIAITRNIIESQFPSPTYKYYRDFPAVVSVEKNFDSLGFPLNHPGRSRTDTYYVNQIQVLRTHTSAHQLDTFRLNQSPGFLISADVYRRDTIDRSHYPVFHQLEGARVWDRNGIPGGDVEKAVLDDLESLPKHNMLVLDLDPLIHPTKNPLQSEHHSEGEATAILMHLKRTLELLVHQVFSKSRNAAIASGNISADVDEPLKLRWLEDSFPFTSPSHQLEVFWRGAWLELLGCGVIKQSLLINAGVPNQLGWAFGVGLERIAMMLFNIPDIRLFWSDEPRFLSQFSESKPLMQYKPYSAYPPCPRDVSFWIPKSSPSASGAFHEHEMMEIVRSMGGDLVESVELIDSYQDKETKRKSFTYRISYRSFDRTLTNPEINNLQSDIEKRLVDQLGVELRGPR